MLPEDRSLAEPDAEKFAKKLLGEHEIEAVLHRLDRLTQDEVRMTLTQTLEVVHGLVHNMRGVMDGARPLIGVAIKLLISVRPDGKVSTDGILQTLGKSTLCRPTSDQAPKAGVSHDAKDCK